MKIRKAFQGTVPENKILDTHSTSQTDTYSCNYVNSKFEWNYLGEKTGTTPITLPSDFNELMVHMFQGGINKNYVFNFEKTMLSSTPEYYVQGGYISAQNCSQVAVEISTAQVAVGYAYNNGANDITNQATITVFYR